MNNSPLVKWGLGFVCVMTLLIGLSIMMAPARQNDWPGNEPTSSMGPTTPPLGIAQVLGVKIVPFVNPSGEKFQMAMVTWKNTGTTPIRWVRVHIGLINSKGELLELLKDVPIYADSNSSPGVAPGQIYVNPKGEGWILPRYPNETVAKIEAQVSEVKQNIRQETDLN